MTTYDKPHVLKQLSTVEAITNEKISNHGIVWLCNLDKVRSWKKRKGKMC